MCIAEQKWAESAEGGGDDPVVRSSSTLGGGDLEQCLSAKFHFVDLAGSERVSKTGNQGERFKGQLPIICDILCVWQLEGERFRDQTQAYSLKCVLAATVMDEALYATATEIQIRAAFSFGLLLLLPL